MAYEKSKTVQANQLQKYKKYGLSQEKMAERLHISTHSYSNLYLGKSLMSGKTLALFLHDVLKIEHPYLDELVNAILADEENEK